MAIIRPLESIYIHIPFCKSKCHYCNFISFADKNCRIKDYFAALEKEISFKLREFPDKKFKTVYIGGGTPSLIDSVFYEKLLSMLNLSDSPELTIEINPGTVSSESLKTLRKIGFNRLSAGVQCFDNDVLKSLNRPHTASEAIIAVKEAKEAGFENISIDLIYGLPGQSLLDWERNLFKAVELDVNHISAYGLKIEENTEFFRNPPLNIPDEDITSQMYLKTVEILGKNGFEHYEISNFAQKGFESRHNLAYWKNCGYFGFGLAAHGYVNGIRYSNKTDLEDYIKNPFEIDSQKELSANEIREEAIFLGLRLGQGLDIAEFQRNYSIDLIEKYRNIIEKYTDLKLMEFDGKRFKLTPQGMLLSNNILSEFLD